MYCCIYAKFQSMKCFDSNESNYCDNRSRPGHSPVDGDNDGDSPPLRQVAATRLGKTTDILLFCWYCHIFLVVLAFVSDMSIIISTVVTRAMSFGVVLLLFCVAPVCGVFTFHDGISQ